MGFEQNSPMYKRGFYAGLERAVAALYEANVSENTIIHLLQKHFDVDYGTATALLGNEKTINKPCMDLEQYLVINRGLSREHARQLILDKKVPEILKSDYSMIKMNPAELAERLGLL